MKLPRRRFLHLAAGAAALPAVARIASAQTYPVRTVTMIVPFAAGGGTDVAARIVGEHMSRTLGQQFIVENFAGAGGTSALSGRCALLPTATPSRWARWEPTPSRSRSIRISPTSRMSISSRSARRRVPLLIVASKDFPAKDLKEFVAYAKANGEKLNMAHAGVGSIFFSYCLDAQRALGMKPTLVPFNGGAPATNALVGGQVDYMCGLR